MFDVFEVAEALVSDVKSRCPDDIAIIAYYGSYAQGTATPRSDLDFFFIPATAAGYGRSYQFVIGQVSFDFWPLSWERAQRMAAFEEPNASIIADCKVLYGRSEDDRVRFEKLRAQIAETPGNRIKLIEQAESQLQNACVHLYKMSRIPDSESLSLYRTEAHGVLTKVLYGLSLLNGTYLTKGWGKNTEQIANFPIKPARIEQRMNTIAGSSSPRDIRAACEGLVQDTLALLLEQKEAHSGQPSYPDRMKGFYEEVRGLLDKIRTACETNDVLSAFFWSVGAQDEISRFLYFSEKGHWPVSLASPSADQSLYLSLGFPNLAELFDAGNLAPLGDAVERLDFLLESHLRKQGVVIQRFETVERFREYLRSQASEAAGEEPSDLPGGLAKPAIRALTGAGLIRLELIARRTEAEIKQLHGIGPNALKQLRAALAAKGWTFSR